MAEKKKKSKWKRRIKKALKLAALGTLGYGAAKMFGGKKKFGTDAGFLKSAAAGGASLSTPPIHGTDHISPVVKNVKKPIVPVSTGSTDNIITRHGGITKSDSGQLVGATNAISPGVRAQILQAKANAPKGIYPPGSVPMPRTGLGPRKFSKGGSAYKKGGRVTGIAKRGFGRALMKGKK